MGLSQRNGVRNSAQIRSTVVSSPHARALRLLDQHPIPDAAAAVAIHASRLCVWLRGMQDHLQQTAFYLCHQPSTVVVPFQALLTQTSYIAAVPGSSHWSVLLGPRTAAARPVFDFITPSLQYSVPLRDRVSNATAAMLRWLMHPLVDTRS